MTRRAVEKARTRRSLSFAIDVLRERMRVEDELAETWEEIIPAKAAVYADNLEILRIAVEILERARHERGTTHDRGKREGGVVDSAALAVPPVADDD